MQLNRLTTRLQFIHRYGTGFSLAFAAPALLYYGYFHIRPALMPVLVGNPKLLTLVQADPGSLSWPAVLLLGYPLKEAGIAAWPYAETILLGLGGCLSAGFGLTLTLFAWQSRVLITRGTRILSTAAMRAHLAREARRRASELSKPPRHVPKGTRVRFAFGTVPFPIHYENLSIVGFGSPGTGKTVWLEQAIRGLTLRRRRDWTLAALLTGESRMVGYGLGSLAVAVGALGLVQGLTPFPALLWVADAFAGNPLAVLMAILGMALGGAILTLVTERYSGMHGDGGLVYDRADLTAKLYNPARGDLLFDPYDARSTRWNIFADLTSDPAIQSFCEGFFPPPPHGEAFWQTTSQTILEVVLKIVIAEATERALAKNRDASPSERRANMQDLTQFLHHLLLNPDELRKKGKKYPHTYAAAGRFLGEAGQPLSNTSQSILTNFNNGVKPFLQTIWALPPKDGAGLSIHAFIDELKAETRPKRYLFLRNRATYEAANRPLYTALLNMAIRYIISLNPPTEWPRVVLVIDEWGSLGQLTHMVNLLNEGRKFGATVIALTQTPKQIEQVYSRDGAAAIFSGFGTKILFRQNDGESAEALSRQIGEQESRQINTSTQMNEHTMAGTLSSSESIQVRKAVLPSELMNLKPFHFFARFPGHPWFTGVVPPKFFLPQHPQFKPFVDVEYRDEIFGTPQGPAAPAAAPVTPPAA